MFNIFGMISVKESMVLDRNSEYFGVSAAQLMENAGKKAAEYINKILEHKNKKIIVFCGTGNNGGDGFVVVRYLAKMYTTSIFLVGKENQIKTDIAKNNFNKLKELNITIYNTDHIHEVDNLLVKNDIIIDSMLGIGIYGKLREPFATIVKKVNFLKNKMVISIDTPTGLGTNLAIKPSHTITFHDIKEGMNKNNSGIIYIANIGIPKDAVEYVGPGELSVYYPKPKKQSHKGDNGSVLVIGGGPYIGAAALTGMAALRTGVDLVFIATPKRSWKIIASYSPNFIVKDLKSDVLTEEDMPAIKELFKKCKAIVIGPGLGTARETTSAIKKIIEIAISKNKSLTIDADAISSIGKKYDILKKSKTVITPHSGEFKKLTGVTLSENINERVEEVKKWAKKLNVSILLKGAVDIISDGKHIKLNVTHNEAMTVGGTGDVLAGIIGALLAKNIEPFNAARIGAFLNGAAGNAAFDKYSYGLLATDIIREIPDILKKYL